MQREEGLGKPATISGEPSVNPAPRPLSAASKYQGPRLFVVKKIIDVSRRPIAAKKSSGLDLGPAKITRSSCSRAAQYLSVSLSLSMTLSLRS